MEARDKIMKRVEAEINLDCYVRTSAILFKDEQGTDIEKEMLVGITIKGVYIDWTDLSRDARQRLVEMIEGETTLEDYEND